MFFILSKTLDIFAQPLVIVCILLLAGLLIRKARLRKILYRSGIFLLFFFSNGFIAMEAMRVWEYPVTPLAQINKQYDYGILLTGITKSRAVPKDRVYFNRSADRATHSLQLYKLGIVKKIIVSGGSGRLIERTFKEADELVGFLILAGVSPQDILIEHDSDNTYESAVEVKKILTKNPGSQKYLLITSGYHLRRAKACFKKAGLEVDTFSVDPLTFPRSFSFEVLFVPKIESFIIWQSLIKEWVGMTAYKVAGYI